MALTLKMLKPSLDCLSNFYLFFVLQRKHTFVFICIGFKFVENWIFCILWQFLRSDDLTSPGFSCYMACSCVCPFRSLAH